MNDITREIYVVFIINDRYTRWEIFNPTDTMQKMYDLLETKYKTGKIMIEINEISFLKYLNDYIIYFARDNSITARITTKNRNYKLSKDIF